MVNIKNKIERSFSLIKIEGNDKRKVVYFDVGEKEILPGQFFMLNYNGCQKPFSVYNYENNIVAFMIEDRGECSKNMINASVNEYFGLVGPLGNAFVMESGKNYLIIGGGIGNAPVLFAADYLKDRADKIEILLGERNKDNIIYSELLEKLSKFNNVNINIYSDDGSYGKKGFVTQDLENIIKNSNFEESLICGPEIMMINALKFLDKSINIQICMERYMKCGIGLCGSCVLDDIGMRVCTEGPVFSYEDTIKLSKEFGEYHRDGNGIKNQI